MIAASLTPAGALDVKIDPRATYLHTSQDAALDASAIALSSAGVGGGDCVHLERLGDFNNGPNGDVVTSMIGVLSRTATLLASSERYRVKDAVDVGQDHTTAPTYYGGQPTDVPEDFPISYAVNGVDLLIPEGVAYLFVTPNDQYFFDNSDPDADYKVRILAIAPFEVSGPGSPEPLRFLDQQTLQWENVTLTCADTFNVYRGDVRDLPLRGYGSCWQSGLTTNTTVDPDAPPSGGAWFYLVSAENAAGEGSLGKDSAGQRRVSTSPCP